MQRESRLLIMAFATAFVAIAAGARAESIGSTCRRICQDQVQACVDGGGARGKCRRSILKSCRTEGVSICLDAGEDARKAAPAALYAPVVLDATAMSPNMIELAWTDSNDTEQGYSIERSMDGIAFIEISQTLANATTYADPGRISNTRYYYRVRAFRVRRGKYSFSSYSTIASTSVELRVRQGG